ncbi:hypothetical protein LCGC14_1286650 [marine sediment metagenome]|uniref:Aminotransferase class III-fold pyridoxal phosphate-dependent enzyme n=1 Tax=marine sediment metagenome TaxID=412755 RepID=A0A0F9KVE0_9ZZZZ
MRGWGLFIGIEIVKTKESKNPSSEFCYYIVEQMREKGILLSVDGPDHNVIKIKPPLVFSRENADELISKLKLILTHTYLKSSKLNNSTI